MAIEIAYWLYIRIVRPCCDCKLPNWLARYYFEPNCFCKCHEVAE